MPISPHTQHGPMLSVTETEATWMSASMPVSTVGASRWRRPRLSQREVGIVHRRERHSGQLTRDRRGQGIRTAEGVTQADPPDPSDAYYAVGDKLGAVGSRFGRVVTSEARERWGFLADDPTRCTMYWWCFWWDDWCAERFSYLWGEEADAIADHLADLFAFAWPWLISHALRTRAPKTLERIEAFTSSDELVQRVNGTNPRAVLERTTTWGAYQMLRTRRAWSVPSMATCPVCASRFWTGDLPPWTYRQFGPSRYCEHCCVTVRNGRSDRWTPETVKRAVVDLADAFGAVPPQAFASQQLPIEASEDRRDRWMRAMAATPNVETIKRVLGVGDWLGALQAVGIVGEGYRTSLGTWCRAEDGHRCRSLLEKSIDDWMSQQGVEHECEPY